MPTADGLNTFKNFSFRRLHAAHVSVNGHDRCSNSDGYITTGFHREGKTSIVLEKIKPSKILIHLHGDFDILWVFL